MNSAGEIIHQRRSLLGCDGKRSIPAERFYRMLSRVMPRVELDVAQRPMPWDAIPWEPAIHFGLFVDRVDGIESGALRARARPGQGREAQASHAPAVRLALAARLPR